MHEARLSCPPLHTYLSIPLPIRGFETETKRGGTKGATCIARPCAKSQCTAEIILPFYPLISSYLSELHSWPGKGGEIN